MERNYTDFQEITRRFDICSVRKYHDLYLECDVLQLADIFEDVRKSLAETHKIDICNYIGLPSATWNAFLIATPSLKIPLYSSTKFAEFFESMIRGGVTSAPLRYAKRDDTHSIIYLDVNGLYPFVMQEYPYPKAPMVWEEGEKFPQDGDLNKFLLDYYFPTLESAGRGACLCVDLVIPKERHDYWDQFPPAPEHRTISGEYYDENGQLYPFLQRWSEINDEKIGKFKGLVGTLYDKKEYGVHWRVLRWYITHGLVVTKIYFAVSFGEEKYLAPYISRNISLRNERSDELGKIVYKLISNALYGKTMENKFNRTKYKIIEHGDKLKLLFEGGNMSSIIPINENFSIVKMNGDVVILDKPTYIGACVTEYAKLHMYELFYDKLMGLFGEKGIELVYTDTDSFIIRVEHVPGMTAEELFKYIDDHIPGLFGKIGGQVKSETGTDLIDEVIALRSKVYSYKTISGKVGKRAKGTTRAAQETSLTWEEFKKTLLELHTSIAVNSVFKKRAFTITTEELMKVALSANDGKRRILDDGIHTHSFGY